MAHPAIVGAVAMWCWLGSMHGAWAEPPRPQRAAPGCAIERTLARCMETVGNGMEMHRCLVPALAGSREELAAVMRGIREAAADHDALLDAMENADAAWRSFVQQDCEAVGVDWEGGSMRRAVIAGRLHEHTLQRARTLWKRHLADDGSALVLDCTPER